MATEIERKFLVDSKIFTPEVIGQNIIQAYISNEISAVVRIRITEDKAYLTIKGKTNNISRPEFEYLIPKKDALELIKLSASGIIEKTRYEIVFEGFLWQIDVFKGENSGLIIAEIELQSESQNFTKPDWIAKEVSNDPKYYNSALSLYPFSKWV